MVECSECGSQKIVGFAVTANNASRGNPDVFEFRCEEHLYDNYNARQENINESLVQMDKDDKEEKQNRIKRNIDSIEKILGRRLILNMEIDGDKCYYIPDSVGGVFPVVVVNPVKKTIEIREQGERYRGKVKKIVKKYGYTIQ